MVLTTNILAAWKFDGDLTDETGTYDATNSGTTTDTSIKILGSASRRYDGTNDKVGLPSTMLDSLGTFSISAWFYLDDDPSGGGNADRATIWHRKKATSTADDSFIWVENSASTGNVNWLRARLSTTGGAAIGFGSTTITTTAWHHVLAVYDGSNFKLYLDGNTTPEISLSNTGNTGTSPGFNTLGAREDGSSGFYSWWDGSIDDVTMWTDAKTTGDVTSLWNSGAGLAYPFGSGAVEINKINNVLISDTDKVYS